MDLYLNLYLYLCLYLYLYFPLCIYRLLILPHYMCQLLTDNLQIFCLKLLDFKKMGAELLDHPPQRDDNQGRWWWIYLCLLYLSVDIKVELGDQLAGGGYIGVC